MNLISIHALREEGDRRTANTVPHHPRFLSTPSARRATSRRLKMCRHSVFLSTPSARRATMINYNIIATGSISIHALREEGDG